MTGKRHLCSERLFVLVLAAGRATRFGSPKQTASYRGTPLVRQAIDEATQVAGERTLLVLGSSWVASLNACGSLPGFFAINDRHERGLSTSIALGITVVQPVAHAVLITLCDQPCVTAADLGQLIHMWNGNADRIVCAAHDDYLGPPALFPRRYFPNLLALEGDRGARGVLREHRNRIAIVECPAATFDIDTPADLERTLRQWHHA